MAKWFTRLVIAGVCSFFILSAVIYYYMENGLPWKREPAKEEFLTFLEDKYKEDFTLGSLYFDFMNGGRFSAEATSEQTGTTFYVGFEENHIADGYAYEYWMHEADRFIEPIIDEFYPTSHSYHFGPTFLEPLPEDVSLQQAGDLLRWSISFHVNKEITAANELQEIDRAFATLQALQSENIVIEYYFIGYLNRAIQVKDFELMGVTSAEELATFLKTYEEVY